MGELFGELSVEQEKMSEIRKLLKRDDVAGVIVSPSGRISVAKVDSPCPHIPNGSHLFSYLVGSRKIVDTLS